MVERGEHHVVAYLAAVAYVDSSVVLKLAAGVDEHVVAYVDVLAEVGVHGRKHLEAASGSPSGQLGHQGVDFLLVVVCRVEPERHAARLLAHVVHQAVNLRRVERPAGLHVV